MSPQKALTCQLVQDQTSLDLVRPALTKQCLANQSSVLILTEVVSDTYCRYSYSWHHLGLFLRRAYLQWPRTGARFKWVSASQAPYISHLRVSTEGLWMSVIRYTTRVASVVSLQFWSFVTRGHAHLCTLLPFTFQPSTYQRLEKVQWRNSSRYCKRNTRVTMAVTTIQTMLTKDSSFAVARLVV